MKRVAKVAVTGVLTGLALAGCTGGSGLSSGNGQGFVSSDGSAQVIDEADREAAPDLSGTTLEGDELSLSDYDGKVVVLNLWGSWCAPCRSEAPVLQEVYEAQRADGVQLVGLNTRDNADAARAFQRTYGITYPSLEDYEGALGLQMSEVVPLNGIPWTVIVDREGRVAARVLGGVKYSTLSDLVEQVTSEQ